MRHNRRCPAPARAAGPFVGLLATLSLAACLAGQPPTLLTLSERTVAVNAVLEFDVAATDPDSETLAFSMRDAPQGATLAEVGGRLAKFRWVPTPAQTGLHTITFVASDGTSEDTETVNVRVVSAGAPVWAEEQYRFVVNPAETSIVKLTLEVRDDDSAEVFFEYDPNPEDWGAEIVENGKRVVVTWAPTAEQKQQAQWTFRVRAIDFDGNGADTVVTILFRGGTNDACPAHLSLPAVTATPIPSQVGAHDYPVSARASDADSDIQLAVVLWTLVPEPQDGDWSTALLRRTGGDAFEGAIPNARLQPGESVTVTWLVCVSDDDDPDGDRCDGWSCTERRSFIAAAGLALCDTCQAGQCGDGLCLENARGETFCGVDCGVGEACPADFYCASIDVQGGTRRQCVPVGCRAGADGPDCSCAKERPVAPAPGELLINEVMFDPPLACPDGRSTCATAERVYVDINGDGLRTRDDKFEEFVELLNVSPTKYLDLGGVTLSDSRQVRFTFPSVALAPGRSVVVFGGGDPATFTGLGGALAFAATGATGLELTNAGDTVTIALGTTTLDSVSWSSNAAGNDQSTVRRTEGARDADWVPHANAPGASGAKWSPGRHVCGAPFPLDPQACATPVCDASNTNRDVEPQSDARATAPCLKPLPQTITSSLAANQAAPASNDPRDLFVIEGKAGQWLHARTSAGPAPALEDTILRLLSRSGTVLAENDDDEWDFVDFYSRLVAQFPSDGVYYVEVTPYARGTAPVSGNYQLSVTTFATEPKPPLP